MDAVLQLKVTHGPIETMAIIIFIKMVVGISCHVVLPKIVSLPLKPALVPVALIHPVLVKMDRVIIQLEYQSLYHVATQCDSSVKVPSISKLLLAVL